MTPTPDYLARRASAEGFSLAAIRAAIVADVQASKTGGWTRYVTKNEEIAALWGAEETHGGYMFASSQISVDGARRADIQHHRWVRGHGNDPTTTREQWAAEVAAMPVGTVVEHSFHGNECSTETFTRRADGRWDALRWSQQEQRWEEEWEAQFGLPRFSAGIRTRVAAAAGASPDSPTFHAAFDAAVQEMEIQ